MIDYFQVMLMFFFSTILSVFFFVIVFSILIFVRDKVMRWRSTWNNKIVAPSRTTEFIAGEDIAPDDVIYLCSDGKVYKSPRVFGPTVKL